MRHKARQAMQVLTAVVLFSWAGTALAVDFDFQGNFAYDNDIVGLDFRVDTTSLVTVFSSSWLQGNPPAGFDPIIAVWNMDAGGTLMAEQDDGGNVGQTQSNGVWYSHGTWDTYYQVNLGPGNYRATIAQFDNFASGTLLSDGFDYDGNPNFTYDNGYGGATQPYFNGVWDGSDGRTSAWQFHILNVAQAAQAPEPTSLALLGLGLAGLAGYGRLARRRKP